MDSSRAPDLAAATTPVLPDIGERRRLHLAGITFVGRRRRPTGDRPPLPNPIYAGGRVWLAVIAVVGLAWASLFVSEDATRWWYRADHEVTYWLADLRSDVLTPVMKAVAALTSIWSIRVVRWTTLILLLAFRRWRHLVVGGIVLVLAGWATAELGLLLLRERPLGVEILGSWSGGSHPSLAVGTLTVTLVVALMTLVPAGRPRRAGAAAVAVVVTGASLARVYLGVDHASDDLLAAFLAAAFAVLVFRLTVPDSVFPVTYGHGRTAHLDIRGRRGVAIRRAVADGMGVVVTGLEHHGLAGSAGSTPLRITAEGTDGPVRLFGKLYSREHLRSDRWYKLGREILYGRLEDEIRFTSVSRLVEYEDYMLRAMEDAGVPGPQPYGFYEISPEREYVLVMEFFTDAAELGEAAVDDDVIDQALEAVRKMWDTRLAHRDLKPANVMVQRSRVVLIDVAFATVRPTPWRQAVDLADMMLILALRVGADRVYERALLQFAAEDLAEAFAATHGVTIPTQLRADLRRHRKLTGEDLVTRFRELAPKRDIVHIQRWSMRRIALTAATLAALLVFLALVVDNVRRTGLL